MAQVVRLKRTSVEGRKPTTSNLELGELAINTFDGKIYFEKDNGSTSIREIATEDTYYFYTTSLDSRYVNLTGNETIAGNKTFSNNVTISGNLSVEGTTTTIDSTTVNIGDNILELNYGGSQTTGGILIKDATGDSTVSGSLLWDSTNDYWKAGKLGSEEEILLRNTHGVISGSSQIDIHNTTGYVANEHIDHSSITIGSGKGLEGGGTIDTNRSLSLHTGSVHFTDGIKSKLNTDNVLSGSNLQGMTVSGSFSGSFQGDGSNLTGITVEQAATVTDTFTNVSSKVVTHNFGTKNVIVTVYDENDGYFIPNSIVTTNDNQVTVTFASTESGRVVVAKGGHVVQGVASDANLLDGEDGTYYLDYDNFTNIPSGIISSSSQLANTSVSNESLNSFTQSAITVSGNGVSGSLSVFSDTHTVVNSKITSLDSGTTLIHSNNGNIIFTVSGSNGELLTVTDSNAGNLLEVNDSSGVDVFIVSSSGDVVSKGHLLPDVTETKDLGSSSKRWRDLYLSGSTIDLGGTLITRDGSGDINFKDSGTQALKRVVVDELQIGSGASARKIKVDGDGKIKFSDKDDVESKDDLSLPNGVLSGSAQITNLTTHKETVSGASSYAVDHNLSEQYPIVQAWNTATSLQELPSTIKTDSTNRVTVTFSTTFAGIIIVKK